MALYIPVIQPPGTLQSGDQCLTAFLQGFTLAAHIDVKYFDQLDHIIHSYNRQNYLNQTDAHLDLYSVNNVIHGIVNEPYDSYCIKAPGNSTFQADDTTVIEGLVVIIPPEFSEETDHTDSHQIFKSGGQNGSKKIQLYQFPAQGT